MGGNSKVFPLVLERANKRLKNAFGYEIVEIMSRAERERLQTGQTEADDEPKKKGWSALSAIIHCRLNVCRSVIEAIHSPKHTGSRTYSISMCSRR